MSWSSITGCCGESHRGLLSIKSLDTPTLLVSGLQIQDDVITRKHLETRPQKGATFQQHSSISGVYMLDIMIIEGKSMAHELT